MQVTRELEAKIKHIVLKKYLKFLLTVKKFDIIHGGCKFEL